MKIFVAVMMGVVFWAGSASAFPPKKRGTTPFGNRQVDHIYEALFTRRFRDGRIYDIEELEPPFQQSSKFPTEGDSYRQALTALKGFLDEGVEKRVTEPLRRAVLQRDLWAVFGTLAGRVEMRHSVFDDQIFVTGLEDVGDTDTGCRAERRALQRLLVRAMRRIALTDDEIQSLPDNFSSTARLGIPPDFDPVHSERAFLPDNLFGLNSPWVAYRNEARGDNLVAPSHTSFTNGRSLFLTFLRLAAGRQATIDFLKNFEGRPRTTIAFPAGTSTLLLRRMVVMNKEGLPRATPLTESVQIRHFPGRKDAVSFFFTLRRKDLFSGRNGGLHQVTPAKTSLFSFETNNAKVDYFESERPPGEMNVMQTCAHCHADIGGQGYHTIRSLFGPRYAPPDIRQIVVKEAEERALKWTKRTYSWGLLKGMWERPEN